MLNGLRNALLSIVFPSSCVVCSSQVDNTDDGSACATCWSETKLFKGSEMLCSKCGAFFNDSGAAVEVFCRKCDDHYYDKASAAGVYEKALSAAVISLKSTPVLPPRARAALLSAFERSNFKGTTLIIPAPLSQRRRLERGFNQAEVLAGILSNATGIGIDKHSLVRIGHSPIHRVAMDQKARELTVRNAFAVTRPKLIDGQKVLIVDDVFTSGATSSYCAKALKKTGAAEVNVLTLARAVMN